MKVWRLKAELLLMLPDRGGLLAETIRHQLQCLPQILHNSNVRVAPLQPGYGKICWIPIAIHGLLASMHMHPTWAMP
jgi:hypothetical protein